RPTAATAFPAPAPSRSRRVGVVRRRAHRPGDDAARSRRQGAARVRPPDHPAWWAPGETPDGESDRGERDLRPLTRPALVTVAPASRVVSRPPGWEADGSS